MIYLFIFMMTFVSTLILIPPAKRIALQFNVVDNPGPDPLKIHKAPVPYLGGAAIFGAFAMGLLLFMGLMRGAIEIPMATSTGAFAKFSGVFVGGSIVFLIGLYDDIRPMSPRLRLLGQFAAGLLLILTGLKVDFIPYAVVSLPLTIFYVMGAINAMNMLDGMDGLATGVGFIASMGFLVVSVMTGNMVGLVLSVLLMGATLGFLFFNFHPASIFMGDSGSTFLGFVLAALMINLTSRPFDFACFFAPLLILGLPIFDTAFAILRRLVNKKPLFMGDRSHFYDLLMDKFQNQRVVCVIVYGMAALFAGLGILLVRNS